MKNANQGGGKNKKLVSVPLRTDLRRQVLERILYGKIASGSHINESRLAEELRVSRTPLREALFQLEREGFVTSSRDRGFFVVQTNEREVREIYPIMAALEGLAIRSSGPRVALSIQELVRINNQLKRTRQPKQALILDTRWHETLIASCPNRKLKELATSLRLITRRYELIYMQEVELLDVSFRQHAGILEALEAGQTETAVSRLEENWRFGMDVLLLRLSE